MNEKKQIKISKTILAAIIAGMATIIAAIISTCNDSKGIEVENITGEEIIFSQEDVIITTTVYEENIDNTSNIVTYNYNFDDLSVQELLRVAEAACLAEEFDYAYNVYTFYKVENEKIALLNLGYMYANGLSKVEVDFEKAKECYIRAECVEADRNLLALYLKSGNYLEMENIINKLLWQHDDYATWDYVIRTVYEQTLEEYLVKNEKGDFLLEIDVFLEKVDTGQEYRGYNPPTDETETLVWTPVGIDYEDNSPYTIWHLYQARGLKYLNLLELMYSEEENELKPL